MLDEEAVQHMIRGTFLEGNRPKPPLTAHELRMRDHGQARGRIGLKLPVVLVAAVVLVIVLFAATPLGTKVRSSGPSPRGRSGETSYSAYGLQVTVPRSWTVRYFPPCPLEVKPGELGIGQSNLVYNCIYQGTGTEVNFYTGSAPQAWTDAPVSISVNGIHVLSSSPASTNPAASPALWYVPSAHAFLYGRGAGARSVLATLRRSTRGAVPAIGVGNGTEYVNSFHRGAVTGPVRVKNLATGRTSVVQASQGHFSFTGPPGRYKLSGYAGEAPCAAVSVTVTSGTYSTWPSIECQAP